MAEPEEWKNAAGTFQNVNETNPLPVNSGPVLNAVTVVPSDTVDLPNPSRALFIGGAGTVTLDTVGGQTVVLFAGCTAGSVVPVQVKRVRATGTTATNLVALF